MIYPTFPAISYAVGEYGIRASIQTTPTSPGAIRGPIPERATVNGLRIN